MPQTTCLSVEPSGSCPARELQQEKRKKTKQREESPEFDGEGGTASSPAQAESCHGRRSDQLPGRWGQGVFTKRPRSAAVNVLREDASLQHTAPAAGAPSLCRFDFSANYKMSLASPPRLWGGSDDSALCHRTTHAAACIDFMPGWEGKCSVQ